MQHSDIGAAAAQAVETELAPQIAQMTTLTPDQLTSLFPTQNDQTQLNALIDLVKQATDDNEATAMIVEKMGALGNTVVKLLKATAIKI